MIITKKDILAKLRELKPILQKEYAVREIGLFGSFSDNSFNENSDIDLLIELEKPIGWKYFTLEMSIKEAIPTEDEYFKKS